MKKYIIAFLLVVPTISFAQTLDAERIDRLNKSVVKIFVDNIHSGTGFFLHKSGLIGTCNEVMKYAYRRDIQTKLCTQVKPIYAEFVNGEKVELEVIPYLLNKGLQESHIYDYTILKTKTKPKSDFKTLKIGSWKNINKIDTLYSFYYDTSGGIKRNEILLGDLVMMYQDDITYLPDSLPVSHYGHWSPELIISNIRKNIGGPVIKLGKTPDDDEVVGLSIEMTYYSSAERFKRRYKMSGIGPPRGLTSRSRDVIIEKEIKEPKYSTQPFYSSYPIGNSICISIDYISQALRLMNLEK